jgi:formylglycine-generating enzyme required for sulfatase activity
MAGNVWQWMQDCAQAGYDGAPNDGSARTDGDCSRRVVRGGSWGSNPQELRSALRDWSTIDIRYGSVGFRLARTLNP